MALTTAQQVRLRIQDPWRLSHEVRYGDSTASGFQLQQGEPYSTIISATASVVNAGWSATGCTFNNALGYGVFPAPISANTAVRFDYLWAVFDDDEIGHFTAVGGGVNGAALEAVDTLMFNAYKRARWAAPDGSEVDESRVFDNLFKLRSAIREKMTNESGPDGGFVSWAEEQAFYS